MLTYLLNPGTRRRKGRRVRRRAGGLSGRRLRRRSRRKARKANGRKHRHYGRVRSHRRRVNRGRRRRVLRSRRRRNPGRRHARRMSRRGARRLARRRRNPIYFMNRGRKASRRSRRIGRRSRRRNPGLGSITRSLGSPFSLLPISFGSGLIGKVAGGIANSLAGGAVVATGFIASGFVVDSVVGSAAEVAADPSQFAKWKRPLAFASVAGLIGMGVGWIADKAGLKNKGLLITLAAGGAAARSFGGFVAAIAPDSWKTDTGLLGSIVKNSAGLADFFQLSDFIQLGSGTTGGASAGMGENESFGLGEDESFGDPSGGDIDCGSGGDPLLDAGIDSDMTADEVAIF